ncbi:MAG: response regulator [Anaerolineae bacterium]|nr:response regulator [Anaerolineae bacterium]
MVKDRKYDRVNIQGVETLIGFWGDGFGHKSQPLPAGVNVVKLPLGLSAPSQENIRLELEKRTVMEHTFLLIGEKAESQWPLVLEQALSPLGKLHIVSEQTVVKRGIHPDCDVIIIDAGVVEDAVTLVSSLHQQQPQARIIVATASPTWQRAREMLKAGAADYIYKSLDEKQLQSEIRAVLETPSSP